jgi:toxin ParE1/3/4
MRLRFRPEARRDLRDIGDDIARDDREAARRFVRLLREKCALLAQNPRIGRERPELRPGLQSFPVQSYVILYHVLDQTVEIVNVVHGSRDIDAMFWIQAAYTTVLSRAMRLRKYGLVMADVMTRSTGRPSSRSSASSRPKYASA